MSPACVAIASLGASTTLGAHVAAAAAAAAVPCVANLVLLRVVADAMAVKTQTQAEVPDLISVASAENKLAHRTISALDVGIDCKTRHIGGSSAWV